MPNLEDHCERTKRLYKVEGRDIHAWIDKPSKRYVSSHRQFRHDTETVRLVGEIFGNKYGRSLAENIALDHIMADHKEEIRQRQEATKELEKKNEEQSSQSEGTPINVRMQVSPAAPAHKSILISLLAVVLTAGMGVGLYMTLALIPYMIFGSGDFLFNPLVVIFFTAIFMVIFFLIGSSSSRSSPNTNNTSTTSLKKRQFPTFREIFSDEKPPQISSVRKRGTKDTGWICSNENCSNVEYFSPNSICPSCGSKTEDKHWSASLLDSKFSLSAKKSETKDTGWHCSNENCPNVEYFSPNSICPSCGSKTEEQWSASLWKSKFALYNNSTLSKSKQETQYSCSHSNVVQIPVFDVNGEPRRVIKKCVTCGKVIETINTGR